MASARSATRLAFGSVRGRFPSQQGSTINCRIVLARCVGEMLLRTLSVAPDNQMSSHLSDAPPCVPPVVLGWVTLSATMLMAAVSCHTGFSSVDLVLGKSGSRGQPGNVEPATGATSFSIHLPLASSEIRTAPDLLGHAVGAAPMLLICVLKVGGAAVRSSLDPLASSGSTLKLTLLSFRSWPVADTEERRLSGNLISVELARSVQQLWRGSRPGKATRARTARTRRRGRGEVLVDARAPNATVSAPYVSTVLTARRSDRGASGARPKRTTRSGCSLFSPRCAFSAERTAGTSTGGLSIALRMPRPRLHLIRLVSA